MAAGERFHPTEHKTEDQGAKPAEGLRITDVMKPGAKTAGGDDLKAIPLTRENHDDAKILANIDGAKLSPNSRAQLQKFFEDGMSGNLKDLAKLADPKNSSAERAFAHTMDKLGYGVYKYPADKSDPSSFDSVQIVEKGQGSGLRLQHRQTDNGAKHFYSFDATHNMDGSVRYDSDKATLTKLQHGLSQRLKSAIDKD